MSTAALTSGYGSFKLRGPGSFPISSGGRRVPLRRARACDPVLRGRSLETPGPRDRKSGRALANGQRHPQETPASEGGVPRRCCPCAVGTQRSSLSDRVTVSGRGLWRRCFWSSQVFTLHAQVPSTCPSAPWVWAWQCPGGLWGPWPAISPSPWVSSAPSHGVENEGASHRPPWDSCLLPVSWALSRTLSSVQT